MTSSAKKKRERKKDFQKPKLKVGKARPKPVNQTDTSFRAKAIVLNQQLNVDAPTLSAQYLHHTSLLSSRADSQRRDSLAYLTTHHTTTARSSNLPLTTGALLDKLCPLMLDGSSSVRSGLLRLLQALPKRDIQDHVLKLLPHIRAGMTHLSRDIRLTSVEVLSWLSATAGTELVSCAGGWYKTLECFTTMLGWTSSDIGKWSASNPSLGENKSAAKVVTALAEFLEPGLLDTPFKETTSSIADTFPLWQTYHHQIPTKSNAYSYLNLFGAPRDAKIQMLEDREDRLRVYRDTFRPLIEAGMSAGKMEGGELGRATGLLSKVLDRAGIDGAIG